MQWSMESLIDNISLQMPLDPMIHIISGTKIQLIHTLSYSLLILFKLVTILMINVYMLIWAFD